MFFRWRCTFDRRGRFWFPPLPFAEKKADTQIFGTLSAHFRIGNIHISSFFVLGRVRKRVELNYSNWPGLTLSSPISSLFYRFYVGSECGLRSNCSCKIGLPCLYDLSYGATWARMGLHYFIDFMSEASVDWGRIVVAKPASPVSMISHMNGLEAQILSIFRRFQREEMEFNCCCSIAPPVFLLWKLLKKEF